MHFRQPYKQQNWTNQNLYAVATDGCPSILGANQGLINKSGKNNALDLVTWHDCILYEESFVAKSLDMPNVTRVVVSSVNWIRARAGANGGQGA